MNWIPTWTSIATRMRKISAYIPGEYDEGVQKYTEAATLAEATLLTSEVRPGMHVVAIDLDLPAALVPSTTPGHHHLYIDKELDWHAYQKLLEALDVAGIIEHGYYAVSVDRRATHLRTPWTNKQPKDTDIIREPK